MKKKLLWFTERIGKDINATIPGKNGGTSYTPTIDSPVTANTLYNLQDQGYLFGDTAAPENKEVPVTAPQTATAHETETGDMQHPFFNSPYYIKN